MSSQRPSDVLTRRAFLTGSASTVALDATGCGSRGNGDLTEKNGQPNILLVISDQQRTDTLGFLGRTPCETPNLDRIAAEGVSFDRALTPCPLCAPARASVFTGKYPHQVNMLSNDLSMQVDPVLTELLRSNGYHAMYAGKWHLGDDKLPAWFDRVSGSAHQATDYSAWCKENGLPDGYVPNDYGLRSERPPRMSIPKPAVMPLDVSQTYDAWITDHAINLIRTRPAGKSFFLGCGFYAPHPPLKVPEPYFSMYDPRDVPEPPNFGPTENEPEANKTSYYRKLFFDHGSSWDNWRKSVAVYWGYVTLLDDQVGRLLACLEDEEVLDETLVVFTSDHGEMLGGHGLWHKMEPYEEALRVPLLLRAPWLGRVGPNQGGASLIDLAPTMLSAAGIGVPEDMLGADLSPAFRDPVSIASNRVLFSEHRPLGDFHRSTDWRLVTDNRFKYIWNRNDLAELYDLANDPHEVMNLAENVDFQATRAAFGRKLRHWMNTTHDPLALELTARSYRR